LIAKRLDKWMGRKVKTERKKIHHSDEQKKEEKKSDFSSLFYRVGR